jgi:hypothetical protein
MTGGYGTRCNPRSVRQPAIGPLSVAAFTLSWQAATSAANSALVGGVPAGVRQSRISEDAFAVEPLAVAHAARVNSATTASGRIP